MTDRSKQILLARAKWLKANFSGGDYASAIRSHMRVIMGRAVLRDSFTHLGFLEDDSDTCVFDKRIFGIPIQIDEDNPDRFVIEEK